MPVNWSFEKCETFADLYEGLTQEDVDFYNEKKPGAIKPDEWCSDDSPHSPWFYVKDAKNDRLREYGEKQGWLMMAQRTFVRSVNMVLMAVMPAPGWGLSEKNIGEAARRILIYQEICGPLGSTFVGPREDERSFWDERWITEEDIRLMVGYSVNYSTVTKTEFRNKVERWVQDKAESRVRRRKADAKKEMAEVG